MKLPLSAALAFGVACHGEVERGKLISTIAKLALQHLQSYRDTLHPRLMLLWHSPFLSIELFPTPRMATHRRAAHVLRIGLP